MALSLNTAWEVRPTNGLDTNGGGFVAGASGTDWSQQNSPQYSVTDGVTNGTTTITSASANFGTDVVGNIMYVQGGTGSITAGWYQITSRTNATTIVVDRSTGLTTGTGATLHIGGALQTLTQAASNYVASNKIFVKAESTISTTAGFTFSTGGAVDFADPPTKIIGYTSSRTDAGRVTIQLSTNTGLTAVTLSGGGVYLYNFSIDCNSLGTSKGVAMTATTNGIRNCKIANFTTAGVTTQNDRETIVRCEFTGGTSAATAAINFTASVEEVQAHYCYIHDNACPGIVTSAQSTMVERCLIVNNTGASSDGIQLTNTGGLILSNTIAGNGRDGIRITPSQGIPSMLIKANILASNGGWGLNSSTSAAFPADRDYDGNGYYNNTSGTRNNIDDTTSNPIDGVSPYTNTLDVSVTVGTPFTNSAGGDFTLNSIANQGALLRGTAPEASLPGATGTSSLDFGCFQHADPVGGGSGNTIGWFAAVRKS